ncbi:F0F1 ATP synthase subunit epsilon [Cellulomonas sp. APG4]|uniref:F0F1 ATP synthase subunit epsilon n=1 Tax=Cellulomonas sp. APG4 TaxID=1538656 RepID=UPI00137A0FB9|nr:F0F1 ATP synthase subunit epsilon [Cellulomonas sp. APG4]
MAHLEVELVATDRKVWSGAASMVSAPAADGDIGILPGHAPLLAVLRPGVVRIHPREGSERTVRVGSGFLSVDTDRVTVVVDQVEDSGTVDVSAAARR